MSDKTRPTGDSFQILYSVIETMMKELGYSRAEAWEKVTDKLLYCLEEHEFDPPSLEQEMEIASIMADIKTIGLDEQAP